LVDLHLHLGSSSLPHTLWELAHDQGIKLPTKNYWQFIDSVTITENTSYDDYLNYFHLTERIQSSTYAIEHSIRDVISSAYRKANVTQIEIRFNPMLRNRGGENDLDKIILSACVGMKKACLEYPVKAGLILMMDRRFSQTKNNIIAKKAAVFAHEGVVGLDIAGPINPDFKIQQIEKAVEKARSAGLKITIHTGEITPAAEVNEVIDRLNPERIGHGIRIIDEPVLMKKAAKSGVVLELCPTSNIRTKAVKDWQEIGKIINLLNSYGIKFTINSDGPELLGGINVKTEFQTLIDKKIIKFAQVAEITSLAKKASFIK